jgi:hypothetical protein
MQEKEQEVQTHHSCRMIQLKVQGRQWRIDGVNMPPTTVVSCDTERVLKLEESRP